MTATPAHSPHPGMTATTARTSTAAGIHQDAVVRDPRHPARGIYQHYHFATKQKPPVPRGMETMTTTPAPAPRGFVVPQCHCGHPPGDHVTARGNLNAHHGPCYACDCTEYKEKP